MIEIVPEDDNNYDDCVGVDHHDDGQTGQRQRHRHDHSVPVIAVVTSVSDMWSYVTNSIIIPSILSIL